LHAYNRLKSLVQATFEKEKGVGFVQRILELQGAVSGGYVTVKQDAKITVFNTILMPR
jgi:hypothetical protein